jgi:hypothetical protein
MQLRASLKEALNKIIVFKTKTIFSNDFIKKLLNDYRAQPYCS